jgi:predicted DNA-binding antitoxin AbrB/MazE fold protein
MSQAIDAVYEDGVFKPSGAAALRDRTWVPLHIEETAAPRWVDGYVS